MGRARSSNNPIGGAPTLHTPSQLQLFVMVCVHVFATSTSNVTFITPHHITLRAKAGNRVGACWTSRSDGDASSGWLSNCTGCNGAERQNVSQAPLPLPSLVKPLPSLAASASVFLRVYGIVCVCMCVCIHRLSFVAMACTLHTVRRRSRA